MSSQQTAPIQSAISGWRILRLLLLIPLLVFVLLVAGVIIMFLRSDVASFRPTLSKIRQMIEVQKEATPMLPPFLIQCLHAGGGLPDHFTARCLLMRYGLSETDALHWHTRTLFWSWSLYWHLSEAERDLLYCACLNDGAGQTGFIICPCAFMASRLKNSRSQNWRRWPRPVVRRLSLSKTAPRLEPISGDLFEEGWRFES